MGEIGPVARIAARVADAGQQTPALLAEQREQLLGERVVTRRLRLKMRPIQQRLVRHTAPPGRTFVVRLRYPQWAERPDTV